MTDLLKVQIFLKDNKDKIIRLLPVFLILLALPLTVILSLNQQNFRQRAETITPDCNNGLICTACFGAPANTCSYGNGTQNCTYATTLDGQACKPVVFNNVICYQINCSLGYSCNDQTCVKTVTPAARPL